MRRCVGHVRLCGKRLNYYVYGNSSSGYGIKITETCVQQAEHMVSDSLSEAVSLAKKLHRSSVFPSSLSEIMEDLQFMENKD